MEKPNASNSRPNWVKDTGNTFYILDEPTTGLHFEDIRILLDVLNQLVDKGNTILVIEHNMDVIKVADWIIDLGPEGGQKEANSSSKEPRTHCKKGIGYTAQYLKPYNIRGFCISAKSSSFPIA